MKQLLQHHIVVVLLGLSSMAFAFVETGYAQPVSPLSGPPSVEKPRITPPALAKLASRVMLVHKLLDEGNTVAAVRSQVPNISWREERLEIEVRLESYSRGVLGRLEAAGLEVTHSSERYARVVGLLDPRNLGSLAGIDEVGTIHPLYGYMQWTGSVNNQADQSIRADLARSGFNVSGFGVEVGVISDSFHDTIGGSVSGGGCNRFLTGSIPQNLDDLPDSVRLLDNGPGGGTDEGAAMAELIHDIAPFSPLAFHSAGSSETEFANAIANLRDCGADIIVDDILFFAEPMFQDGPVAQAAQAAVNAGVAYYSAAGNSSTWGVDEIYSDVSGADGTLGDDFHDFGGGDRFAEVVVPGGCTILAVLQWNDPFDGALGPGASDDLDLLACTTTNVADCTFGSTGPQGCAAGAGNQAGDPLEILALTNIGATQATVQFAVDQFCGDDDTRFRIAMFGLGCSINSFGFEAGIFDQAQIYGHAAAEGAEAVGAVFYGEIDAGGDLDPPLGGQIDVEPFSSLGGNLPFYFDGSGNPLSGAPVTRFKPEIAGPDGSNTTFFGTDIGFDPDSHPNFFGTSAAAPHAAGVAALVLEASPSLAPNGVNQVLESSARDIETAGVDNLSGYGLIDAWNAVQTVSPTGSGCVDDLQLSNQIVNGTQFFRACNAISAGDNYRVSASGNLAFRAGERITLGPGFSIEQGGAFSAQLDPSL